MRVPIATVIIIVAALSGAVSAGALAGDHHGKIHVATAHAAVNGSRATWIARYIQQPRACGSFWWSCAKAWAPAVSCYGRGSGAWVCRGGVTEKHKITQSYRNCGLTVWVASDGHASRKKAC